MENVDERAAETLVTDRFQTLLSEGKVKRVRENSPVKENYSRMQSANVSSAKFSNPSLLGNSKGLSINCESKFINRTSIVLSPADHSPELVLEIGPLSSSETLQGTKTLILKTWKDGKPFGSSLFSTQEKMVKIKDEKDLRSGESAIQENRKRPPPLERCQTLT